MSVPQKFLIPNEPPVEDEALLFHNQECASILRRRNVVEKLIIQRNHVLGGDDNEARNEMSADVTMALVASRFPSRTMRAASLVLAIGVGMRFPLMKERWEDHRASTRAPREMAERWIGISRPHQIATALLVACCDAHEDFVHLVFSKKFDFSYFDVFSLPACFFHRGNAQNDNCEKVHDEKKVFEEKRC